jgi:hypothetical protein
MMHFCLFLSSFVALYSGQTFCVYMGCTDIDYCIYDICGFMDGFGFLLWLCVWICVWMCLVCVWVCVWVMCLGYVYGYRVSIFREVWFNKYRGLPLLGARFHHHWDLLASRGPLLSSLGLTRSSRPVSIIIGTYSLLEAHFIIIGSYSLLEARFISSLGITRFSRPISSLSGLTRFSRPI